jgi:hypothetical protein
MRTKIMKGTPAVLTADKESDSAMGKIMAARPTTTAVAEEGHTRRRLNVTSPLPSSPTAPSRSSASAATATPGL